MTISQLVQALELEVKYVKDGAGQPGSREWRKARITALEDVLDLLRLSSEEAIASTVSGAVDRMLAFAYTDINFG